MHADRERRSAAKLPAHRPADPESPLLTCLNSDPIPYTVNSLFSVGLGLITQPAFLTHLTTDIRSESLSTAQEFALNKALCLMGSLLQQC